MKLHEYAVGDSARRLSRLYKALAHPVRLLLLQALLREEACVCHLTCLLHRPQPYVSQQLSALKEAGLVGDWREGQIINYRVTKPEIASMIAAGLELLRQQGLTAELPALPSGPLAGCTCPRCQAHEQEERK